MTNGVVPHSAGIDTEMQCGRGFSHTKGWIFVDTNYIWYQVLLVLLLLYLWQQIFYNCKYTWRPADVHSRLIASLLPVTIITKEKHPIYVSADQSWIRWWWSWTVVWSQHRYGISVGWYAQYRDMKILLCWQDKIGWLKFMNLKLDRLYLLFALRGINLLNRW